MYNRLMNKYEIRIKILSMSEQNWFRVLCTKKFWV